MAFQGGINLASIYADLAIDSTHLERGLANARKALTAIEREIEVLQRDFSEGAIGAQAFNARLAALGTTATDISNAMNGAYSATTKLNTGLEIINANANQMTSGASRMAMAMMQVGYAIDDLQYGFSAIVNNIGPIVYGFSGNAGMGAAAQIASVGVYQLYAHWDQLMAALEGGIPAPALDGLKAMESQLKLVQKEMDELRKKSALTMEDLANFGAAEKFAKALAGATKEAKAVDKMAGGTKEERDRGSAFTEAVREQGGPGDVSKALQAAFSDRADKEGAKIGKRRAQRMMQDEGITNEYGHLSKGFAEDNWIADNKFSAEKMNAFASGKGMKFDLGAMNEQLAGGADPRKIIEDQIRKQKVLADKETGELMTPEAMARRTLAKGAEGNKDAAATVGGILGPDSAFSKSFAENSPEAKKSAAAAKEAARVRKQQDHDKDAEAKRTHAEEMKALDDQEDQFQKDLREWKTAQAKKKQDRKDNERESREAAPGVDDISKVLAGQAQLGGITPDMARQQIKDYLKSNGRTDKQAEQAAEDIYKDADNDVREGVIKRALNGDESHGKPLGKVEQFNAADVASKFQNSVGATENEPKKQTSLLERIEKAILEQNKAGSVNVRIVKK